MYDAELCLNCDQCDGLISPGDEYINYGPGKGKYCSQDCLVDSLLDYGEATREVWELS